MDAVVMLSSVCGKHFDENCYSCKTAKQSNDTRLINSTPTEGQLKAAKAAHATAPIYDSDAYFTAIYTAMLSAKEGQ